VNREEDDLAGRLRQAVMTLFLCLGVIVVHREMIQ
jgi:hypothetical protein